MNSNEEGFEITFHYDGKVTIEGVGIQGGDCLALTREVERMLGKVTTRTKKKEFFETPRQVLRKV